MKDSVRLLDAAAPPAQASLRDDLRARALLQRAQGTIQKWPEGFAGFRARLTVAAEAVEHRGWVTVAAGAVDVDITDEGSRAWLGTFLAEIVADRTPSFFKDGDGRFPITFDEAARDAGEEWLLVHHGHADPLRYRLDARGRLCQREESGAAGHHVRTYEAFVRATPGRVLPVRRSTVIYEGGRIVRSELVEDAHCCVRHAWLPAGRRLHVSHLDATTLRWARLENHILL